MSTFAKQLATLCFEDLFKTTVGGAVASWLVHSTLERAVRVRALAGQDTLLSLCHSPPRCINEYRRI